MQLLILLQHLGLMQLVIVYVKEASHKDDHTFVEATDLTNNLQEAVPDPLAEFHFIRQDEVAIAITCFTMK